MPSITTTACNLLILPLAELTTNFDLAALLTSFPLRYRATMAPRGADTVTWNFLPIRFTEVMATVARDTTGAATGTRGDALGGVPTTGVAGVPATGAAGSGSLP